MVCASNRITRVAGVVNRRFNGNTTYLTASWAAAANAGRTFFLSRKKTKQNNNIRRWNKKKGLTGFDWPQKKQTADILLRVPSVCCSRYWSLSLYCFEERHYLNNNQKLFWPPPLTPTSADPRPALFCGHGQWLSLHPLCRFDRWKGFSSIWLGEAVLLSPQARGGAGPLPHWNERVRFELGRFILVFGPTQSKSRGKRYRFLKWKSNTATRALLTTYCPWFRFNFDFQESLVSIWWKRWRKIDDCFCE